MKNIKIIIKQDNKKRKKKDPKPIFNPFKFTNQLSKSLKSKSASEFANQNENNRKRNKNENKN